MIRAKMRINAVVSSDYGGGMPEQKEVLFQTSYDPSIPEDQKFCKATPNGSAKMAVDNPAALAYLKPGKSYYVDFTEVPIAQS